jgi:Na+-transporting NADH:ubiquinone oxidoreductase subunit C
MKLNKNNNSYTFLYAAVLVVVVATALSLTATGLRSRQQANREREKKQALLAAVHIGNDERGAAGADAVDTLYERYIVERYIVGADGERREGDAFAVDMKAVYDRVKQINARSTTDTERAALRAALELPVFVCCTDEGTTKYILPVYGLGLWGAVWGYVSFDEDANTIYGATFDHKGETPGLGAEIATPRFAAQFRGRRIFDNGAFTSVRIVKGGAAADDVHAVDAISGGTITSRGVEAMLRSCLAEYAAFFAKQQSIIIEP